MAPARIQRRAITFGSSIGLGGVLSDGGQAPSIVRVHLHCVKIKGGLAADSSCKGIPEQSNIVLSVAVA